MVKRRLPESWRAPLRRWRDHVLRSLDRMATAYARPSGRQGVAIFMPHGLGDLILFTAAYQHLRAHYAGQPVTLICSPANIAYARAFLEPEHAITLNRLRFRRDPLYRCGVVRALHRAGVAIVVQPARNREHMVEDALVRASGAPVRIGAAGSADFITAADREAGDPWYTSLYADPCTITHDAEHYAAFTAWTTGRRPTRLIAPLPRPPRPASVPQRPYLVVAGEASSPVQAWLPENFALAAQRIAGLEGMRIVQAGSRERYSIREFAAILAHARLVLCNDSGPVHLAAVLGVPAVAVGNGGMPGRYLPYPAPLLDVTTPVPAFADTVCPAFGCGWRCQFLPASGSPVPCVADVTVDAMVNAALSVLRQADG